MDANSWAVREQRYLKKFEAGRKFIPTIFDGVILPEQIDQVALFGFASNANVKTIGGGRVWTTAEFFAEIVSDLINKKIAKAAVPEQFPLLRTIQFTCEHHDAVNWR